MKIVAVIPVRKGSQRVRDKNLRPFSGTTLLDNKIQSLLKVPELDEIVVNTNSEAAIEIVDGEYVGTKVRAQRRDEYYASSQCSGSEFFKHLGEVTDTEVFVYAPCTSPFIRPETVSRCIQLFKTGFSNGECDCVSTVSDVKDFLWKDGAPLNYDPLHAPNSQDLPDIVALNFGVTVVHKEVLVSRSNIIGLRPKFVKTSDVEAFDIDTQLDYFIAEQVHRAISEGRAIDNLLG